MARLIYLTSGSKGRRMVISGTLGDRVYSSWKGISYTRSKPLSVKNPRTPGQIAQRAKFSEVMKFLKPCKEFLRIGLQTKAKDMSPFNYAMSFIYKNALTGVFPDFTIDYSKVLLSIGNLAGASEPKMLLTSAREIEFTWQIDQEGTNYFLNDVAMVLILNPAKQEAITIMDGNIRNKLRQLVELPATFAGDEVICYMAFQDHRRSRVSDSQFIGRLQVE